MKVIDLLNKVANGEEVPEKIKVGNIIYIYESWEHFYYTDNEEREDLLVRGKDYSTIDFLNWNVELIEDEIDINSIKEIDKIEATDKIFTYSKEDKSNLYFLSLFVQHTIVDKLNELVQAVKQLNKEIKELKESEDKQC